MKGVYPTKTKGVAFLKKLINTQVTTIASV